MFNKNKLYQDSNNTNSSNSNNNHYSSSSSHSNSKESDLNEYDSYEYKLIYEPNSNDDIKPTETFDLNIFVYKIRHVSNYIYQCNQDIF